MYPTISQQVTNEQLAACTRIIDETTGKVFYRVKSAHSDEEYEVHFVAYEDGSIIATCTCKAGQMRVACWHIRAAIAHHALQQEKESPPLSTYRARDHLIKIKSKDGTMRDYLPAAWRFYELSLIPMCVLMDKFEWKDTHANTEQCYLLERTLVSDIPMPTSQPNCSPLM